MATLKKLDYVVLSVPSALFLTMSVLVFAARYHCGQCISDGVLVGFGLLAGIAGALSLVFPAIGVMHDDRFNETTN